MTIRLTSLSCALLLLLSPSFLLANDIKEMLRFAQSLQAEGEYYRAITEYKRVLFVTSPDSTAVRETAILGIAGALFSGGEYGRSAEWLHDKLEDFNEGGLRTEARHLMYRSLLANGNGSRLLSLAKEVEDSTSEACFYKGLALAQMGRWREAGTHFRDLSADNRFGAMASVYSAIAQDGECANWKNPNLARALGIIPGLGYWYAGYRQTAIASLLVNAAFVGATIQAYRSDQDVLGGFLSLFTVSWYAGNVYGSGLTVHRYNRYLQEDLWRRFEY